MARYRNPRLRRIVSPNITPGGVTDFGDGSDWTFGGNWTVSTTAVRGASATGSVSFQTDAGILSGDTLRITYTVSSYTGGQIRTSIGDETTPAVDGQTVAAVGTYTDDLVSDQDDPWVHIGENVSTGALTINYVEVRRVKNA